MYIPAFTVEDVSRLSLAAEAEVCIGVYRGNTVVIKTRRKKAYRLPHLDRMINRQRTSTEVKVLRNALLAGIPVPSILMVNPLDNSIVMEYIDGQRFRDTIGTRETTSRMKKLGEILAKLHSINIVHGDLTTSNVILSKKGALFLIDFGLAKFTSAIEDFCVDMLVLKRTLYSTHAKVAEDAWSAFLEGYFTNSSYSQKEILKRFEVIEKRKRYTGH